MKGDFGCPENQFTAMVVSQVERSLMRLPGGAGRNEIAVLNHKTSCLQLFSLQATKMDDSSHGSSIQIVMFKRCHVMNVYC